MQLFKTIYNRIFTKKTAQIVPLNVHLFSITEEKSGDETDSHDSIFPTCPICIDTIRPPQICKTACNHDFHTICLERAIAQTQNCPMCRTHINHYVVNGETIEVVNSKNAHKIHAASHSEFISYDLQLPEQPPQNSLYNWFNIEFKKITDSIINFNLKTYISLEKYTIYNIVHKKMRYLQRKFIVVAALSIISQSIAFLVMLYIHMLIYMIIGIIYYTLASIFCLIDAVLMEYTKF